MFVICGSNVLLLKDSHSGYCCRTFSYTILGTHLAGDHANSWAETGHLMREPGGSRMLDTFNKMFGLLRFQQKSSKANLKSEVFSNSKSTVLFLGGYLETRYAHICATS